MNRKLLSALAIGTMASVALCMGVSAEENKLSVYAWDANFNIPALEAAEADYKEKSTGSIRCFFNGRYRDRTCDLSHVKRALSQLS